MRTILLVSMALCLASCGTPQVRDPIPTPAGVYLAYPLYLQPTADCFAECAGQQRALSLFLTPISSVQSNLLGPLLQLQLGGSFPDGVEVYQLGEEEIVFIVNSENPTSQLSTEQLLAIYTGLQLHWDFGEHLLIEFWSYPAEDSLRSLFESALPGTPRVTSRAQIAPTPNGILEAVANHIEAIGYLPSSWLNNLDDEVEGQVKVLNLEQLLAESLIQPVLITVDGPLTPEVQALLACLQQPED
jgi:hypothetical protein